MGRSGIEPATLWLQEDHSPHELQPEPKLDFNFQTMRQLCHLNKHVNGVELKFRAYLLPLNMAPAEREACG